VLQEQTEHCMLFSSILDMNDGKHVVPDGNCSVTKGKILVVSYGRA
jgi:hypothetical protein